MQSVKCWFNITASKQATVIIMNDYSYPREKIKMNERTELDGFKKGYARGQLAMIKTMEFALRLNTDNEQLARTLNKLKKQIGVSNEES